MTVDQHFAKEECEEKNLVPELEKAGLIHPIRNLTDALEKKANKLISQ